MISLKRLERMRMWRHHGAAWLVGDTGAHVPWGINIGLLYIGNPDDKGQSIFPTERLAPAISEAEAEHERHRTMERREQARREADYRYLLWRAGEQQVARWAR